MIKIQNQIVVEFWHLLLYLDERQMLFSRKAYVPVHIILQDNKNIFIWTVKMQMSIIT